jgi:uncharacterized sporulation protein YeaH/YhbH (DUF444 family)
VDEHTFFHSPETGGTVVSSALRAMERIVAERYPPEDWNIYAAQASDGDNSPDDNSVCAELLMVTIVPVCQYFAYLEVGDGGQGSRDVGFIGHRSALWRTYEPLQRKGVVAMRRVTHRREIFPVFRALFERGGAEMDVARP